VRRTALGPAAGPRTEEAAMPLASPTLAPELDLLKETVKRFTLNELNPHERAVDDADDIPPDLYRRLRKQSAELGIIGTQIPEEFGGAGQGCMAWMMVREALGWTSQALRLVVIPGSTLMVLLGTRAQQEKFIPPVVTGDMISAFALTEPGAGSDPQAMETTAVRSGDHWVLNGSKHFITNGSNADYVIVFALTDKAKRGHGGITAFIVEKGSPGFKYGKGFHSLGWRGVPHSELIFEDCQVPLDNVLGDVGEGFKIIMRFLDENRLSVAASAVGTAERMLTMAIDYAKQRKTFGQPLADRQAIQWMLADSAVDIHAARLMTYHAAEKIDRHERVSSEAGMAKLFATEAASRVVDRAMQVFGGIGAMKDLPIEIAYRDIRLQRIGEGTSEIQRMIIGRQLLA
jgi:alkylation response protein AidB-like acyl-CoA dehydrogenase